MARRVGFRIGVLEKTWEVRAKKPLFLVGAFKRATASSLSSRLVNTRAFYQKFQWGREPRTILITKVVPRKHD